MFKLNKDNTGPRFLIFIADIVVCFFAILLAYLLRFDFRIPENELRLMFWAVPAYLIIRMASFWIGKTFAAYVRYTSIKDAQRILLVILSGSALMFIINGIKFYFFDSLFLFPTSVLLIDFFVSCMLLLGGRILVKLVFYGDGKSKEHKLVLIYGAGEMGITAKKAIEGSGSTEKKVVGFIDDDKRKVGNRIEGVKVYHSKKLAEVVAKTGASEVIFGILNPKRNLQQRMVDLCLAEKLTMLHVPAVNNWINGELSINQIKNLKIEDLLERSEIVLDSEKKKAFFSGKVVLVTGAAGSIGSEICRQILKIGCKKLWLLDQAETPLYEIEQELLGKGFNNFETIIADVTQEERMDYVMSTIKANYIFHVAAYKHVPLMEGNPSEAIKINAIGTYKLGKLALKNNAERFVFVSTDKAVNPTNVMGASKRLGEILLKSLQGHTKFIATRFGNVLGSNGSVIPLFKRQIEAGGPITITHPEITRYFMTIPEACSLVLEAGLMGSNKETFVFDMGESVKIVDLAKNMIRLYGLEPDRDIKIIYTGLRPGEKLYEETLAEGEKIKPTHHPKIHIFEDDALEGNTHFEQIKDFEAEIQINDNMALVSRLKRIIPEYKSNNSEYSKLDS